MRVRVLLPGSADEVDSTALYAPPQGRHLRVNMVSSVDGAATIGGRVGILSGSADQVLLHELRDLGDVLLVGAGTIRAEGYAPLAHPRLAVLSGSLDLDLGSAVFSDPASRPVLVTTADAARRHPRAEEVADLLVHDGPRVDLRWALDKLALLGLRHVLSEGGPHTLHQLFADDLVDELCLAIAPVAVGGDGLRAVSGPPIAPPRHLLLSGVCERDGYLFLRYTRG